MTVIPVLQELLRLAPTILLIAGYVWFTRRQMGGLGGQGPGGRGLFNVGKAQVRTPRALFQNKTALSIQLWGTFDTTQHLGHAAAVLLSKWHAT